MSNRLALGVDVGGVIIDRVNDGTDTSFFSDNYLNTTAVPEAFSSIRALRDKKFGSQVFIVSKCGIKTEMRTLEWMAHHDFYNLTGINEEDVLFCRRREDKAPIAKELGLTHFVDDKLEVLSYMSTVATKYLFQPSNAEVARFSGSLPDVERVDSWDEIVAREVNE